MKIAYEVYPDNSAAGRNRLLRAMIETGYRVQMHQGGVLMALVTVEAPRNLVTRRAEGFRQLCSTSPDRLVDMVYRSPTWFDNMGSLIPVYSSAENEAGGVYQWTFLLKNGAHRFGEGETAAVAGADKGNISLRLTPEGWLDVEIGKVWTDEDFERHRACARARNARIRALIPPPDEGANDAV